MYIFERPAFLTLAAVLSMWYVSCQSNESETFPWQGKKLPKDLIPLHYDIFIAPSISRLYYTAEVNITLRATKHTDIFIYMGGYNERHHFHVYSPPENGNATPNSRVKYMARGKYNHHYVQFSPAARPGDIITAHATFSGPIDQWEVGAHYNDYMVNGSRRRDISMYWGGLSVIPGLQGMTNFTHTLRLAREAQYVCVYSMPLVRTTPYRQYGRLLDGPTEEELDNVVIDEFETSSPPYLVFFSIGQWVNRTTYLSDGTPIRVFAPEDQILMTDYYLDTTVKALEMLSNYTGVPFPWPKLDLVPFVKTGAMSPRGQMLLPGYLRYFRKGVSPPYLERNCAVLIIHEIVHQWFPHYIHEDLAKGISLSEGLAQFVSLNMLPKLINTTTADAEYRTEWYSILELDSFLNTHAIGLTYDSLGGSRVQLIALIYYKTQFVFKMMERVLGADVVREGFRLLFAPGPRVITRDDIWNSMETATNDSGIHVKSWMETWIQQAGFPLVTLSRAGNQLHLRQTRFLRNQSYAQEATRYTWEIPFTYTSSAHPHETKLVWVRNLTHTLTLPESVTWVKGNADTWGIYRVNYDTQSWKALENQLMENHTILSPDNRINLIKDAFSLAWSGMVPYETALGLTRYLPQENTTRVRAAVKKELKTIQRYMATSNGKKLMVKFIGALKPPNEDENSIETTDEPKAEAADTYRATVSVKKLSDADLFRQWKQNENTSIPPSRLASVFRAGCRVDREDWDVVFARAKKMRDPSVQSEMLVAMALVPDVVSLKRLLNDPSMRDDMAVFVHVWPRIAKHTPRLFWRFLRQHFIRFSVRHYGSTGFKRLRALLDQDDDYFPEVKTFIEGSLFALPNRILLEQWSEKVEERRTWSDRYSSGVTAWLTHHEIIPASA